MTEDLSKDIDRLVDRIDALIVMRTEKMQLKGAPEACDELRTALADALCDFVAGLKEEVTR